MSTILEQSTKEQMKQDPPIPFFKIVHGLAQNVKKNIKQPKKKKKQQATKSTFPVSPSSTTYMANTTVSTPVSTPSSTHPEDPLWIRLRQEAITVSEDEPIMKPLLQNTI